MNALRRYRSMIFRKSYSPGPPTEQTSTTQNTNINRHSPDDIQIRGNGTTVPLPKELYPLFRPPDGMVFVIGPRLEGHSVIMVTIQTHPACCVLLGVEPRALSAPMRQIVGID